MANCDRCGRSPLKGNARSHSNIKTIRRQMLNLQTKRIDGVKLLICANCLKSLNKPPRKKKETKKD